MRTFEIQENVLLAMTNLAGKKDIRYYLNGVHVDITSDYIRIVATDGHLLGIFQQTQQTKGDPVKVIIPTEVIAKLDKNKGHHILMLNDSHNWSIGGIAFVPLDGTYPDYMRVLPKGEMSNEVAQFNPDFLARFAKVAKLIGGSKNPTITVAHNGNSPAWVDIGMPMCFIGVMMPLRSETILKTIPTWLKVVETA